MQTVELWRWRIQWIGRWTKTRHHASEAEIRKEHPEAIRIDGTCRRIQVPVTPDEQDERQRAHSFSINAGPPQRK